MTKAPAPPVAPGPRWAALFSLFAAGALLVAACGDSPGNGKAAVAHLGTTKTAEASSSPGANTSQEPTCARGPDTRGPGWLCISPDLAHCMQTHGAPNVPDPNAQGWAQASGTIANSPGFRAASNHCMPGSPPVIAPNPQDLAQALKFSRCMRSHGIADYPDPQPSASGGSGTSTQAGKGSDLNPKNPRFQAAATACGGK